MLEKVVVTEKELDELVTVIHEVWPEAFTLIIGQKQVAYMLETYQSKEQIGKECAAGVNYFLLKLEGKTIGYTAYEKMGSSIYLSKLYILRDVRGKGLTSEVFRWYEQLAKETEAQEIFLRVNQGNQQAIAVYQHQGFVIEGELISNIGEGFQMVDYKMKKRLA